MQEAVTIRCWLLDWVKIPEFSVVKSGYLLMVVKSSNKKALFISMAFGTRKHLLYPSMPCRNCVWHATTWSIKRYGKQIWDSSQSVDQAVFGGHVCYHSTLMEQWCIVTIAYPHMIWTKKPVSENISPLLSTFTALLHIEILCLKKYYLFMYICGNN